MIIFIYIMKTIPIIYVTNFCEVRINLMVKEISLLRRKTKIDLRSIQYPSK